jgi:hypothetical protein
MTIPGHMMIEGLQTCSATLKRLRLKHLYLTSTTTWQMVFAFLRRKLQLEFFKASYLRRGEYNVEFQRINYKRPLHIDAGPDPVADDEDEDEEMEVNQDDTVDSWLFINHDTRDCLVALDAIEEGDDVQAWLAIVEKEHELVEHPEWM